MHGRAGVLARQIVSPDPRGRCSERTLVCGSRVQYAPRHDGVQATMQGYLSAM